MEKRTPHHSLERIQALVRAGAYWVTQSALRDADHHFDLDTPERIAPYVLALTRKHFYKAMTRNDDYRVWQDVYRIAVRDVSAYVKPQISADDETVVISFKKKDQ